MSTIQLAAQRSYTTNEPVWFSYRLPSVKKLFCTTLLWLLGLLAFVTVGVYAHLYWNLQHPAPETAKVNHSKPEAQLSDMHYVYVSKPFPQPAPKPLPKQSDMPPLQEMPINADDADWQQAPDADVPQDISRDTLPDSNIHGADNTAPANDDGAIKELLLQAIKDQQKDYSQGKVPAPPTDETSGTAQVSTEKHDVQPEIKKSPFTPKGHLLE
ncbi:MULTISPECIES: hypothetical protein [Enterobacterales]|uniref:hypothetical protein n=1 Tax=Enterobacterales TaxID=91347 RepID=UPI002ED8E3E9